MEEVEAGEGGWAFIPSIRIRSGCIPGLGGGGATAASEGAGENLDAEEVEEERGGAPAAEAK